MNSEFMIPRSSESVFRECFGAKELETLRHFFSPGRVNLMGEHLDYNGGLVLPAAINLGIHAVVRQREDRHWNLVSTGFNGKVLLNLDQLPGPGELPGWGNHVAGVLVLLQETGVEIPGADVLLTSTLPVGSGLSSSAALEMLCSWIAVSLSGQHPDPTALAVLAQSVEARFLGVNFGIMDPYAIAHGVLGNALLLDCSRHQHQLIRAQLPGYQWVILDSKKPRTLAGSAYNQRRKSCEQAAKILGLHQLAELKDSARLDELADPTLKAVARHVWSESLRVIRAAEALESADSATMGDLLKASHASLRDDYQVSCPEMDFLVDAANSYPGVAGARMTGAGFGGCAVAMVREDAFEALKTRLVESYRAATGIEASFFAVQLANGVAEIQ